MKNRMEMKEDISSISTRATAYNLQRDPVDIKNFPVMSTEPYTLLGKDLQVYSEITVLTK